MTQVDIYNQETLSDDRLVQRFAMAAVGMSINGFSNWLTGDTECSWGSGRVTCNSLDEVVSIVAYEDSLSGSIPVSIGLLTNIEFFRLSNNQFTGKIPSEVGSLTALTYLSLFGNALTGTIPSEVGGLTALTLLKLASNALTGSIPTDVGGLARLRLLWLENNALTGTMPDGVCEVVSPWIDCGMIVCDCCQNSGGAACP